MSHHSFAETTTQATLEELNTEINYLKRTYNQLVFKRKLALEKQRAKNKDLTLEVEHLETLEKLEEAKLSQTLQTQYAQRRKLKLDNAIKSEQQIQTEQTLVEKIDKLKLENTLHTQRLNQSLAELDTEHKRLTKENDILGEKYTPEILGIKLNTARLEMQVMQIKYQRVQQVQQIEALETQVSTHELQQRLRTQTTLEQNYRADPLEGKRLYVTDRKINLDGVILPGSAKNIIAQIHFFNSKNATAPIFLFINDSPGGSVMEGFKILRAMQASQAPVYVVVRAYAASMAAVLTSLAKRSFAYPDAIILHHQVAGRVSGNLTEQSEYVAMSRKWFKRLLTPVADKMGISLDAFQQAMYQHDSTGDWQEFANDAINLKWIDHVILEIEDDSYVNKPNNKRKRNKDLITAQQQTTAIQLPHLNPYDVYHLHDPHHYYQY
jgi:ATP-dependent Clp protease protease subunit